MRFEREQTQILKFASRGGLRRVNERFSFTTLEYLAARDRCPSFDTSVLRAFNNNDTNDELTSNYAPIPGSREESTCFDSPQYSVPKIKSSDRTSEDGLITRTSFVVNRPQVRGSVRKRGQPLLCSYGDRPGNMMGHTYVTMSTKLLDAWSLAKTITADQILQHDSLCERSKNNSNLQHL